IVTAIMRGDGAAAGKAARDHVSIVSEASAVFAADGGKPVRRDVA
ncbi:MAG: GntR family transcriptional regulator, partial [Mesorhizobium sp.]